MVTLAGRSPITNRTEIVTIYTTQMRSGELFYVATVAPENEMNSYSYAFNNLISSFRFND